MIWIVIGLIILAVVLYVSRLCYRLAFYNLNIQEKDIYAIPPGEQYEEVAEEMLQQIHDLNQLPFEQIYIKARDGVRLAGRYYEYKPEAPVQIMFHGYRSSSLRDYSGGNRIAAALGYNTLVVDERAHGKSGGHTISFGILERYDCVDWANYVCNRFGKDNPMILSGVSMGAATVLMASELELPSNVAGIVADCPYSTPGAIIRKVCHDMKLPTKLLYPFAILGAMVYGKFLLWKSSPVKAVKNTTIPIQLIHGSDDRFVPCEMSRQIYNACAGPKRLEIFPGAGHGLSSFVDPQRYQHTIRSFLESCGVIR